MARIEIRVLGGGREVGRAAIAVGNGSGKYVLMDYGVNFNERDEPQLPLHIKPSEIAALAITHAHLDHIGAAPFLYTTSQLPALMTSITRELGELMVHDFMKLSGYYLPFEQVDLDTMLDNINEVTYGKTYEYEDYGVEFINAGHGSRRERSHGCSYRHFP
jgi:putative mRNA 3-end processing factor